MAEIAAALQPAMNAHFAALPHESLADKRELSTEINADLRELGLGLRCPSTGRPAILVGDFMNADHRHVTRFRFQTTDDRNRKVRLGTTREFPSLELMEDEVRREVFSRGFRPRGAPDAGPGR